MSVGHTLTGPMTGLWRYRVDDYPAVCRIEDSRIVINAVAIGHRSNVYR